MAGAVAEVLSEVASRSSAGRGGLFGMAVTIGTDRFRGRGDNLSPWHQGVMGSLHAEPPTRTGRLVPFDVVKEPRLNDAEIPGRERVGVPLGVLPDEQPHEALDDPVKFGSLRVEMHALVRVLGRQEPQEEGPV